jgi:hypothetical protein
VYCISLHSICVYYCVRVQPVFSSWDPISNPITIRRFFSSPLRSRKSTRRVTTLTWHRPFSPTAPLHRVWCFALSPSRHPRVPGCETPTVSFPTLYILTLPVSTFSGPSAPVTKHFTASIARPADTYLSPCPGPQFRSHCLPNLLSLLTFSWPNNAASSSSYRYSNPTAVIADLHPASFPLSLAPLLARSLPKLYITPVETHRPSFR